MKKLMAVLGLMGMVGGGFAGAQTWDVEDKGPIQLIGCYGKQDGVYCDLSFTLTKKQTDSLYFGSYYWKIYMPDGTAKTADAASFIDGKFGNVSNTKDVIANVPLKVQIYFNIPNNITSFRALSYNNQKFDNIPVRPYGAATSASKATQLPFSTSFGLGNYKGSFSNCQQQGADYVCNAKLSRK